MIRREQSPALMGSLALHAAVAAALLVSWPWARDLKVGSVVPVTIVANAPADPSPAEQAPLEQPAMTEAPAPEAPPEVVPPAPQPVPAPPTPAPKAVSRPAPPTPAPKPAPTPKAVPTPTPKAVQTPAPKAPPQKALDFAALEASVSKLIPRQPAAKASSAPKGPTQSQTAPVARETQGSGLDAGAAMAGLAEELQRRWNPNCEVEGGRDVIVRVVFTLNAGGQVAGSPTSQLVRGPSTSVGQAAAERAVRSVYAAAPFRNLPREFYGERIAVNFNAREACS